MDDETLEVQLGLRITPADMDRITALVDIAPVATRQSLARHALRLGLTALEKDPSLMLSPNSSPSPSPSPSPLPPDKLSSAAHLYALARSRAKGRALKIAQAREAFDHAVDDYLAGTLE